MAVFMLRDEIKNSKKRNFSGGNEMKTIQDVIDKRNELFEKIMDNASFMMIYNGDLAGEEDEEELLRKMQKLDDAIYDFQHDDCGCERG